MTVRLLQLKKIGTDPSGKMFRYIHENLKAIPMIPPRAGKGTGHARGKYRKEMPENFSTACHRRPLSSPGPELSPGRS